MLAGTSTPPLQDTNETVIAVTAAAVSPGERCPTKPFTWLRVLPGVGHGRFRASTASVVPAARHGHVSAVTVSAWTASEGGTASSAAAPRAMLTLWLFGGSVLLCPTAEPQSAAANRACTVNDLWRLQVSIDDIVAGYERRNDDHRGMVAVTGTWVQLTPTTPLPPRAYLSAVLIG